jgi:hypothetical protein
VLRFLFRALLVVVVLALGAGGFLWYKLRAQIEPIPSVLAAVDDGGTARIRLPGAGGLPDLNLGELRGSIVYLVLEGKDSMESGEGREVVRALDRWQHAEGVRGYFVGEAEGLGFLKWKIDEFVGALQRESRLPVYMDYEGAILRGFKLPKGHTAVVVLGQDGEVVFRKSGKPSADEIEALRVALGAREPEPPRPAPVFAAGPLDSASCAGQGCALVFLSRKIAVTEVPGVEGGKKPDDSAAWGDPDARLVGMLSDQALPAGKSKGVFVGELDGVKLASGWSVTPGSAELRATFGLGASDTAVVVIDREGRLALRETGVIPFWKVAPMDELLDLPPPGKK